MRKICRLILTAALFILGLGQVPAWGALPPRVVWEYQVPVWQGYIGFLTLTPQGTILVTCNGPYEPKVMELNRQGEIIWEYGPIQANSAVPLPNGHILIADSGAPGFPLQPRLLEVNKAGQVLWSHAFAGLAESPRLALPLTGDRYLVVFPDRVAELDRSGRVYWQQAGLLYPVWAERLGNGNTLIVDRGFYGGQVLEVNKKGQVVWTYGDYGAPGQTGTLSRPVWATRLSDGSTLISDRGKAQLLQVQGSTAETIEKWPEVFSGLSVADRWVALPDLNTGYVYLSLTLSGGRSVIWQVDRQIETLLAGAPYQLQVPPVVLDGVLYGGARELIGLVGGQVTWQAETKQLEINLEGRKGLVTVDSPQGFLDGEPVTLIPPRVLGGTTLLPLDFVRDYFGLDYSWDAERRILELRP